MNKNVYRFLKQSLQYNYLFPISPNLINIEVILCTFPFNSLFGVARHGCNGPKQMLQCPCTDF